MGMAVWTTAALAQRAYDPNDDPNYNGRYDNGRYDRYNRYDRYDDGNAVSTSTFLREAAMGGRAEVSMAILARRRAQDPDVRDFADQMVQDHSVANRQLERLAARRGWSLPSYMDQTHQLAMNRLRQRTGRAFDRQYMREMVRDHQTTLQMFRGYARNGADAELRAWANQTLPTLMEHRRMASETMNAGYGYGRGY